MTFLETLIRNRTRHTPSGGSYRIGDATISVWYSADIWEWEYLDDIYWDIRDLALALMRGTRSTAQSSLRLFPASHDVIRQCLAKRFRSAGSPSEGGPAGQAGPFPADGKAGPLFLRLVNYRVERGFKDPHAHP